MRSHTIVHTKGLETIRKVSRESGHGIKLPAYKGDPGSLVNTTEKRGNVRVLR